MVIPKSLREELGISGPTEVELTAADGALEVTVPDVPARVEERDGEPVIVPERPMAPMTVDDAREAIDRTRR
jgi:bifunctional DNA-binding transcriptional regulator/antitoxin component of YhaV-PrlF toxin-antitoxin module